MIHVMSLNKYSRNVISTSSHFKNAVLCSFLLNKGWPAGANIAQICIFQTFTELKIWCVFIYEHNKPEQCQLVISYVEVQIVNKAFVYTLRTLQHYEL